MIRLTSRPARVVLSYGRFDMFHQGHVQFLRALSQIGDDVIIGCTTDALAIETGAPCVTDFATRRATLEHCRFVSRVIPQSDMDQKRTDIVNYNACVLAMGDDSTGVWDDLQDIAQVLYLPRATRPQVITTALNFTAAAVGT